MDAIFPNLEVISYISKNDKIDDWEQKRESVVNRNRTEGQKRVKKNGGLPETPKVGQERHRARRGYLLAPRYHFQGILAGSATMRARCSPILEIDHAVLEIRAS
jgi:hypothetical protein